MSDYGDAVVRHRGDDWVWDWTRATPPVPAYLGFEVELRKGRTIEATLVASSVSGQYGGEDGVVQVFTEGLDGVCDATDFGSTPTFWIWAIQRSDTPAIPPGEYWMRVRVQVQGQGMVTKIHEVVVVK